MTIKILTDYCCYRRIKTDTCNQQTLINQNQEITAKEFYMMEKIVQRIPHKKLNGKDKSLHY